MKTPRNCETSPTIIVRHEGDADAPEIHRVHEAAFGRRGEADLVDALRGASALEVSLVAMAGGRVVGHVALSPVVVEADGGSWTALGLGPVAVLPELQGMGIGSALCREGLRAARAAGGEVVMVLGHPGFYARLGFVPAEEKGLISEYPAPEGAFRVAELVSGALRGRRGLVRYRPEFRSV
jgi:putative acetyltransferase